jgi:hypothetical protein
MFIIEDVTNRSFPKDGFRMPLRTNPTKKPLIPLAQVTSPPKMRFNSTAATTASRRTGQGDQ